MSSTPPHFIRRNRPRNVAKILLLATASACSLMGCESALDSSTADRGSARYAESLMARSLMQNQYQGDLMQAPTVAQGVRELPRVDSTGPTMALADSAGAATAPASTMTIPTSQPTPAADTTIPGDPLLSPDLGDPNSPANDVGNSAAALNQPEKVFNLSLQDAISRTLKNALDIKTESYAPAITESQVIQQEAVFDAEIFGASNYTNTDEPALVSTFNNGIPPKPIIKSSNNTLNGDVFTNQVGIRRLLPTGGTAQLSAGLTYRDQPSGFGVPNGYSYSPNLNATLTQPLLRGFGTAVNEANISITQRDHRISKEAFRRQVITSVANVEEAYHNLTLARTTVAIQERLLAATEDTYKRVNDRILVDADQISVNQAIAAVEQRRAELINDRMALRQASDNLKGLINDPEISIFDNALINPTDKPVAEPITFNPNEAIQTGLQQRTELQEDRLKLEQTDIRITVAKNDLLPQLDLTASVQANGLERDLEPAIGSTVNGNFIDYSAGLRLTIPLRNRAAEAEVRQRKLERNQQLTQIVADAQKVVQDVKNQLRELLGRYKEVEVRELARVSAARELKAITDKEKIVALTPEFLQLKLDSQSRLAQSEQSLIQSIVNYNLAIMRLQRAEGTLLEFDRISLDRAPIARAEDDYGKIRFLDHTYNLTK